MMHTGAIFRSREEVELVMEACSEIVDTSGMLFAYQLLEMTGLSASAGDYNRGWADIKGFKVEQKEDGWLLSWDSPEKRGPLANPLTGVSEVPTLNQLTRPMQIRIAALHAAVRRAAQTQVNVVGLAMEYENYIKTGKPLDHQTATSNNQTTKG